MFQNIMTNITNSDLIFNQKSQNIPHSWLISGPTDIAKSSLIYDFVQQLFANIPNISEKIKQGTFSDFLPILSNNKEINVKEVREITKHLSLTAAESKYRMVMIDNAELMNKHAANALLKILEEPPANSIIILVCNNPIKILPTIRSRCRHIKLSPNKADNHQMQEDSSAINFNHFKNEIIDIISKKQMSAVFPFLDKYNMILTDEMWGHFVSAIVSIIAEIIQVSANNKNSFNDSTTPLLSIAKNYKLNEWFIIYEKITLIFSNVNLLSNDKKQCLITVFGILTKAISYET